MFENTTRTAGQFGCLDRDPSVQYPQFKAYASALPPAEPAWSNLALVQERLAVASNTTLFPIDGNDTLGDCTIAGAAHGITMQAGLTGLQVIPSASTVISTYNTLSGGRDNGLDPNVVLKYWQQTGIAGNSILASVEIDPSNWDLVKQGIQFFGGLYATMRVPTNANSQFNAGVPWTGGKLTRGGHCIWITDYNADGSGSLLTWGNKQDFTPQWYEQCVNGLWVVVSAYTSVWTNEVTANLIADAKALAG